jgi:hypothetical protein
VVRKTFSIGFPFCGVMYEVNEEYITFHTYLTVKFGKNKNNKEIFVTTPNDTTTGLDELAACLSDAKDIINEFYVWYDTPGENDFHEIIKVIEEVGEFTLNKTLLKSKDVIDVLLADGHVITGTVWYAYTTKTDLLAGGNVACFPYVDFHGERITLTGKKARFSLKQDKE